MLRVAIALFLLFAMPVAAVTAQERSRKWWMGPQAKELGLSTDQSSRIDRIYEAAAPRIHMAWQDAEKAQQELDRLIAGEKTTETDVVRQLVQVQAIRNELDRQYTLMLFRFNQELTPEQRMKVKAMFDRGREGRRGQPPPRKK